MNLVITTSLQDAFEKAKAKWASEHGNKTLDEVEEEKDLEDLKKALEFHKKN